MPAPPPPIASRRFRVEAHGDSIVLRVRPFDRLAVARAVMLLLRLAVVPAWVLSVLAPQHMPTVLAASLSVMSIFAMVISTTLWALRISAFTGDVVSTVQRTLTIRSRPAADVGYRQDAARAGPTLLVDGREIARERLRSVGVARVEPQHGIGLSRRFFGVTIVLDDGMVRVERCVDEAEARQLALSLATALDIACDLGELPREVRQADPSELLLGAAVLAHCCLIAGAMLLVGPGATVWRAAGVGAAVLGVDALTGILLSRKARSEVAEDMRQRAAKTPDRRVPHLP